MAARVALPRPTFHELILSDRLQAEADDRKPYRPPTGKPAKIKLAVRPLMRPYGLSLAEEFGSKSPEALRILMLAGGLCRRTANQMIGIVVRVFRRSVENEMIPPGILRALKAVQGLRSGR